MISIGFIFGIIAFALISLIWLGWVIGCFADDEKGIGVISFIGWWLIALPLFVYGMWPPFNMQYHSYRPISGTVTDIQSRLISAGDKGGTNQKYVVTFKGSPQPYACEDTRCALIRKGDYLSMKCIRVWQYASNGGYDCRFVDYKSGGK